jgi:glycosyl transferase family 2
MNGSVIRRCKLALRRKVCLARRVPGRVKAKRTIAKADLRAVPVAPDEIRAFLVVRNEALRLPFVLDYYFAKGIDRIFVLDNRSSDETPSIVLERDNTHLFSTGDNFANKAYWVDHLLRIYGIGHWCVIVDADELLIYPYCESLSLADLCRFLDDTSSNAMDCVLLDMYPEVPLTQIGYRSGTDPLQAASWFDGGPFTEVGAGPVYMPGQNIVHDGPERLFGGMRKRVFDANPCLSKIPLVKFTNSMFLSVGTHLIEGAHVSDIRGALLHFKYLQDFSDNVQREAARGQYWKGASEYKRYWSVVGSVPQLNLHNSSSIKYENSRQLVELGIMKASEQLARHAMHFR